ncbi:hypothetical protein [Streptomyces sp. NPDC048845]|uniref:hypothetical protein n=1 Tax=Streptomyces sp. NPDC048845 TaxID=3155390 RepID=UPI00341EC92D
MAADDPDTIVVMEVRQSKDPHDASPRSPEAREAIAAAMPMLTGRFSSREPVVAGGLGADD